MTKHDIKIINTDNIDTILNASFDTIDPNSTLSSTQRQLLIRELKKNLRIKRENEWMSMEDAAKQAEARGLDEHGRETRKPDSRSRRTENNQGRTGDSSSGTPPPTREQQEGASASRSMDEWSRKRQLTPEERIKKAQETYETHYTRQEVSNIFSQGIQTELVSPENRGLASKVTEMQNVGYRYMKQTKKKLKNPNKFIQEIRGRFK